MKSGYCDAADQLSSVSDPDSTYAFTYTAAGELATVNNSGTPGVPQITLTMGYNFYHDRTSVSDNWSTSGSISFAFDVADRLTQASMTVGGQVRATVGVGQFHELFGLPTVMTTSRSPTSPIRSKAACSWRATRTPTEDRYG